MNASDLSNHVADAVAHYPLVAVLVAIAGGLFSTSICPCTLPTGVGIASYVGTRSRTTATSPLRRSTLLSLAFFAGLIAMLTALGAGAALVGHLLTRWNAAFALGAAGLTFVAGVGTLGGPWLRERVPDPDIRQRSGMAGAFAYGVAYSVATITSSGGPLLLLLTVATAIGRVGYGAVLSLAFAVGRGLPFLVLGLYAGWVGAWLERVSLARRRTELVSGVALVGLSAYFVRLAVVLGRT